jgi:hypothetical protein
MPKNAWPIGPVGQQFQIRMRQRKLDTGESAVKRKAIVIWTCVAVAAAAIAVLLLVRARHLRARSIIIHGAIIRHDEDTRKELPIGGVVVTASNGTSSVSTRSDASGYFTLNYPPILWPGRTVDLSFRSPGYEPLDLKLKSGIHLTTRELYLAAMAPIPQPARTPSDAKLSVVSNIKVRYTVNSENMINVGSDAKTFQVVNKGNVPCNRHPPCSPDGNWKAARGSITLDAGERNELRGVRASCIAGPCPFTRIDPSGDIEGGRTVTVTALDWSDTATFLLEAEVFHDAFSSNVRELYPVIFGQTLNFTLPPTQEGVSIEAEIDGTPMVFPLGPDLYLSWATCAVRNSSDSAKTTVYRCELKPGYRF